MALVSAIYAPTMSGKTNLLATFARGLYQATGQRTRLYTGDGGGWLPMSDLVESGVVDAWDLSEHEYPFQTVNDAVRGFWPKVKDDPASPLHTLWLPRWRTLCVKCGDQATGKPKQVLTDLKVNPVQPVCQTCKTASQVELYRVPNPDNILHNNFGAVFFEGLTAFSDMFMDNMSDRSAKGEKMGEEVAVKFKDGDLAIAGSSRSSYGIAQRRTKDAVDSSRHLPVRYVFWTALEDKGKDDLDQKPMFGPKLAGHAATDDAPRWFGSLFYVATMPKGLRRVYVRNYNDPENPGIPHYAGLRLPGPFTKGMPDFYDFPEDSPTLLWDIMADFEKRLAESKAKQQGKDAATTVATKESK